ncbi:DUF2608 domain-containing protein [Chlamydiifrater phoenicopteri]|uniref:DUF2608 domain-containing protein n=1 Tax=Chlamydiifrater phoenicopteri TaxID=2681469 RepID=UPI001BCFA707|nr:DUF2608 domain-containing protein [Chlamydiifrater phoenicopteri]
MSILKKVCSLFSLIALFMGIGFGNVPSEKNSAYIKEIEGNRLISINFLNEIAEEILFADDSTITIVGLDNTLLQGAEALSHKDWFKATVSGFMELGLSKEEAWLVAYPYWVEYQKKGSVKLVEEVARIMVSRVLEKNKLIIGCTDKCMEDRALVKDQLNSVSINFSPTPTAFMSENKSISSFADTFLDKGELSSGISSGVLFLANKTNTEDFRKILLFLRDHLKEKSFKKIIFLDEDSQRVGAFHQACKELGFPSLSATYKALRYQPQVYSPELSKIQHTFTEKLLSNDAAALLFRNNITS